MQKNSTRPEYQYAVGDFNKKELFETYVRYINREVSKDILLDAFIDLCLYVIKKHFWGASDFDKDDYISEALISLSRAITDTSVFNYDIEEANPSKMASYAIKVVYGSMLNYFKVFNKGRDNDLTDYVEGYVNRSHMSGRVDAERIFSCKEFIATLPDRLTISVYNSVARGIPEVVVRFVILKLLGFSEVKPCSLRNFFNRGEPERDIATITVLFRHNLCELYSDEYMFDKQGSYSFIDHSIGGGIIESLQKQEG